MTRQTKYSGSFVSRDANIWRIDIWQMADNPFQEIGELVFPADEPVIIEWEDTQKHEVVCPSAATIRIESPGDRTYIDLYAVNTGDIGVSIYRNETLYWQGTLDTELYEEPYERERNYDVMLTFQDFGPWGRLKYNLQGLQTMENVINDALRRVALDSLQLDCSLIASYHQTSLHQTTPATPSTLSVRSDNFYDKDGEGISLQEVVTGMLQPLGQRIVQKDGKIYIYDLAGLYENPDENEIQWSGDSQTLGTDRVYNKVKVTLDPNASGKLLDPKEVQIDIPDETITNVSNSNLDYFTFYSNNKFNDGEPEDPTDLSFTIFTKTQGKGIEWNGGLYFKTVALNGGQDDTGILGCFVAGHDTTESYNLHNNKPNKGTRPENSPLSRMLMYTKRVFIPHPGYVAHRWMLRLKLEMLCDMRYNPFTEPGRYNEEDNYDNAKEKATYAFVPCDVVLWDAPQGGNPIAQYSNTRVAANRLCGADSTVGLQQGMGEWEYTDLLPLYSTRAKCWLAFYDNGEKDSRSHSTGILGWKANRQQIGARDGKLLASIADIPDGEYIPYPTQGGWLDITVWSNIFFYQGVEYPWGALYEPATINFADADKYAFTDLHANIRWLLYKAPQLDIVSVGIKKEVAESEDVVTEAIAAQGAEEELNIDTICGTMQENTPSARAQIFHSSDNTPLRGVAMARRFYSLEELLARTLAAQYGTRRTTLSGEAHIVPGPLCKWTEQNQGQRRFMLLGEEQNLINDTTEGLWCELAGFTDTDSQVQAAQWSTFLINKQGQNVIIDAPEWIAEGDTLHASVSPWNGYDITSITVSMGEQDVTQQALNGNAITIDNIIGDVTINAKAVLRQDQ